jgi:hypothetical protein
MQYLFLHSSRALAQPGDPQAGEVFEMLWSAASRGSVVEGGFCSRHQTVFGPQGRNAARPGDGREVLCPPVPIAWVPRRKTFD